MTDSPSGSSATLLLDVSQDMHRVRVKTPNLIDGRPESGASHYLNTSDVLCISPCDKRTSHMLCLRLLLTVW